MTEYKTSKDVKEMMYTILFRTDNTEAAARVEDTCKKEVENDIKIPEPKPCPFCGSNDRVCYDVSLEREGVWLGIIGCNECHLTIKHRFHSSYGKKKAEITLIETWNRRKGK